MRRDGYDTFAVICKVALVVGVAWFLFLMSRAGF